MRKTHGWFSSNANAFGRGRGVSIFQGKPSGGLVLAQQQIAPLAAQLFEHDEYLCVLVQDSETKGSKNATFSKVPALRRAQANHSLFERYAGHK